MTTTQTNGLPASAVAIVSGGLDSVTLAYHLVAQGTEVRMLSFDYGQSHRRELGCARKAARDLGAWHRVLDLSQVGALLVGSALTDLSVPVPDGHYTDESMRATVVPNRNALMLDVAVAVAASTGCAGVAFGAHGGDHAIYPDCRPEFVAAFESAARLANAGFVPDEFRVWAPFLELSKSDIVRLGAGYGVPFDRTWSCYRGGELHCGSCGTCTERREAFTVAGVPDPTAYAAA